MGEETVNKRAYPDWAIPTLETVGLDYRKVRGILGGQGRVRNLTPEQLRRIAMKGVRARRAQTTPEQRRAHASHAGKIGNAKRWAGHVKKVKPQKKPRGHNAREAGRKGNEIRWGSAA
mgnify:CR=1 FL=1